MENQLLGYTLSAMNIAIYTKSNLSLSKTLRAAFTLRTAVVFLRARGPRRSYFQNEHVTS